jgi:hypothetical protein
MSAFTDFVNAELPRRVNVDGLTATEGKGLKFTGVGLQVEEVDLSTVVPGSLLVGTSAQAQYSSIVDAYEYAKTDDSISKIFIEPGTYNETGYLDITLINTRFKGFEGTDPVNRPVINFSDSDKSVKITGSGNLTLINCQLQSWFPSSDHTLISIESGAGDNPNITLDNSFLLLLNPLVTSNTYRIIGRPSGMEGTPTEPQIHLENGSVITMNVFNTQDPSGTISVIDIPYTNSETEESGSSFLKIIETSTIGLISHSNNDVVFINWEFLKSIYIKNPDSFVARVNSGTPANSNLTWFRTFTDEVNINCVGMTLNSQVDSSTPSSNNEHIYVFDCATIDSGSFIKTRNNKFFPFPATGSNVITKNARNSIVLQHVLDEVCDDVSITSGGDGTEILTYSLLTDSGKIIMTTGSTPLVPSSVIKVGPDGTWSDYTTLEEGIQAAGELSSTTGRTVEVRVAPGSYTIDSQVDLTYTSETFASVVVKGLSPHDYLEPGGKNPVGTIWTSTVFIQIDPTTTSPIFSLSYTRLEFRDCAFDCKPLGTDFIPEDFSIFYGSGNNSTIFNNCSLSLIDVNPSESSHHLQLITGAAGACSVTFKDSFVSWKVLYSTDGGSDRFLINFGAGCSHPYVYSYNSRFLMNRFTLNLTTEDFGFLLFEPSVNDNLPRFYFDNNIFEIDSGGTVPNFHIIKSTVNNPGVKSNIIKNNDFLFWLGDDEATPSNNHRVLTLDSQSDDCKLISFTNRFNTSDNNLGNKAPIEVFSIGSGDIIYSNYDRFINISSSDRSVGAGTLEWNTDIEDSPYTVSAAGNWSGSAPDTITGAMQRMEDLLVTLNGGAIP